MNAEVEAPLRRHFRRKRCKNCARMFQPMANSNHYCSELCAKVGISRSRWKCYGRACDRCGDIHLMMTTQLRKAQTYVCRACKLEEAREARRPQCRFCRGKVEVGLKRKTCEKCYSAGTNLAARFGLSRQRIKQLLDREIEVRGITRGEAMPYVEAKLEAKYGS